MPIISSTKRETRELVRAYYKGRVRKRIVEMVKAVGAANHAEMLGSRKGHKTPRASS